MIEVPGNSLAFHPQFDNGVKREDLLPLIDEALFSLKRVARQDSRIHEIVKAKVPKATELAGLEIDLAKEMTSRFNDESEAIFDKAMEEMQKRAAKKGLTRFTAKEANEFLDLLGPEFKALDIGMQKEIAATMGAFYRFGRNTPIIGKVRFKPSFSLVDRQAQKFLEKDTLFWIGDHYDSGISSLVRETALNDMVLSGLGRKAAGKQLERNFSNYIKQGIIPEGITIPSGWKGSSQDYFTGLVANARNKATTYSRIITYQQAGVETYEIVAVMDRRTSAICTFMNGQIFNVSWASDTLQKVFTASTPEESKDAVGWKRAPEAMEIAGVSSPSQKVSPEGSFALHQAGLDFPPYHFRCRTTVVASSQSEIIVEEEEELQSLTVPEPPKISHNLYMSGLTPDVRQETIDAIEDWTLGGYVEVRQVQMGLITPRADNLRQIKLMEGYARAVIPPKKGLAYRGISLTDGEYDKFKKRIKQGVKKKQLIISEATESYTKNKKIADDFALEEVHNRTVRPDNAVIFKTKRFSGIDVERFPLPELETFSEEEIIMGKGSKFKIKGFKERDVIWRTDTELIDGVPTKVNKTIKRMEVELEEVL